MKTRVLIVEDEPLAVEVIKAHISQLENLSLIDVCNTAVKAFECLKQKQVDLMFLDIQMPGMTGIDLLKTLNNPPEVIITTAYKDFAIDGYEYNVLDYLLKPISFDRFLKAVNKYFEKPKNSMLVTKQDGEPDTTGYIIVKSDRKHHRIKIEDIICIESDRDYIKIHQLKDAILVKQPISTFVELLPPDKFLRIHRSYIVAIAKIKSFNATEIEIGSRTLPIGRNYKNEVFSTLKCGSGIMS